MSKLEELQTEISTLNNRLLDLKNQVKKKKHAELNVNIH